MEKNKVLPGQLCMEEVARKKKETSPAFKLTPAEKRLIKAYYKYRSVICEKPTISDILFIFKWDEPTRTRYVPAWRDFSLDDQEHQGAFELVRGAISGYLVELDEANGSMFDLKFLYRK